jgi:putative nucleotidyltransferase with HDIG domain
MKTFKQHYYDVAYLTESLYNSTMPGWDQTVSGSEELQAAIDVMEVIEDAGGECLIVGGAVRDMLMGKQAHDIDLATNMHLDHAERLLQKNLTASSHDIGNSKDFGVFTVVYNNFNFELAHYRTETGQRMSAEVELVKDFTEDSDRRDITINSMGMKRDGTILDPNGGQEDIQNGIIRAVGDARARMSEDPLRMLRAIRFAAKFGFELDDELRQAISEQKDDLFRDEEAGIGGVSPERLGSELWKAASISGEALANYIQQLKDNGLLEKFLPEIDVMDQFEQSKEHHPEGNVYNHTIEVLKASKVTGNPVAMLATLFHDVGKPVTYKYIEPTPEFPEGKHTYFGHDGEGEKLWHEISEKLRYPNNVKKGIGQVIAKHMFPYALLKPEGEGYPSDDKIVKNTLGLEPNVTITYGGEEYDINLQEVLQSVNDADIDGRPSDGEVTSKRQSSDKETIWNAVGDVTKKFGDAQAIKAKMQSIINGDKIKDWLPELETGPIFGKIINATKEWVFNQHPTGEPTDDETREFVTNFIKSGRLLHK